MLKDAKLYSGKLWLNKLDSLVGKAENGRYYRKYRLIENGKFHTLTVFANKASELFSLPDTVTVRKLPVTPSTYRTDKESEVLVFSTELSDLIACMKQ
jgi:hypothetical protein